ncbi:HK97 gp10 family phage protein [Thioclava sp. BHET1]|nr:HK97 gp10 family phage protein [Thioclava sp. BHET1]
MVIGLDKLHARFQEIPERVRDEVTAEIEKIAEDMVRQIRSVVPVRGITIGWTWGDAPRGAIVIKQVRPDAASYGKVKVTIYAVGRHVAARWFEFGTAPRFQRSGKSTGRIMAQPFFFPVYRANKSQARARLSRAVTRGFKKTKAT